MQLVALKTFSYRARRLAVGETFDASEADGALLVRIGQARRAPVNGGPPGPVLARALSATLPEAAPRTPAPAPAPVAPPTADAVEAPPPAPPAPVEPPTAPARDGDGDDAQVEPEPSGDTGDARPRKRYKRRDLTPED